MSGTPPASLPLALSTAVAIQALASAAALALTAIAPLAAADIGVSPHAIGYQISLVYLSATLMSSFAGSLVRKWGPARMSQMALLAGGLGLIGLASAHIAVSVIASVLIGAGYALTNPSASDLLNRITPPAKRNLIFSLKQTGVPIGGILVGLALPSLALMAGWRWGLLLFAAFIFALMLALQSARPVWDAARDPSITLRANMFDGLRFVWRRPSLRSLAIMSFLFSAMQLSLVSFVVVMLAEEFGWQPVEAGFAAAAVQTAGALGRVFWGMAADRTQAGLLLLAAIGGITSASAALMPMAGDLEPWLTVALLCLFSAASIGWNGVMLAEAARLSPPGQAGPVTGGVLAVTFFGVVVGPSLFAASYQLIGGYAETYAWFALLPLLGSILIWRGSREERREVPETVSS